MHAQKIDQIQLSTIPRPLSRQQASPERNQTKRSTWRAMPASFEDPALPGPGGMRPKIARWDRRQPVPPPIQTIGTVTRPLSASVMNGKQAADVQAVAGGIKIHVPLTPLAPQQAVTSKRDSLETRSRCCRSAKNRIFMGEIIRTGRPAATPPAAANKMPSRIPAGAHPEDE